MEALVIDDASVMRRLLRRLLEKSGFAVTEAVDGVDALEKLQGMQCPKLILVDWNMPRMNGIEFVHHLRDAHICEDSRIMFVTSESELSHVVSALSSGAHEYIMKPFTNAAFFEKLTILGLVGQESDNIA